jgi:hypothetical protein
MEFMTKKVNYRRIEKGTVLGDDWYYVVVSTHIQDNKLYLYCLCDNANNIYSFSMDEILNDNWLILSVRQAMHIYSYGVSGLTEEDEERYHKMNRKIPADVIAEVLSGQEDDRFDHWYED